jgi:hypothetical protein
MYEVTTFFFMAVSSCPSDTGSKISENGTYSHKERFCVILLMQSFWCCSADVRPWSHSETSRYAFEWRLDFYLRTPCYIDYKLHILFIPRVEKVAYKEPLKIC